MKNVIVILGVAILLLSIALGVLIVRDNTTKAPKKASTPFPPRGITLNCVSSGDADEMVMNFRSNPVTSHAKTAIWLDKAWVENVYRIVKGEGGDGIRMYFAKKPDTKFNTMVIVSTYRSGFDNHTESGSDHADYYDHNDPFFTSIDAYLKEDYTGDKGAHLFDTTSPCNSNSCNINSINHIPCPKAWEAIQNFYKCGTTKPINTYSEWFSLSVLKELIDDMNAALAQTVPVPADGIRIYFARHTDTPNSTNPHHPGRNAFIIVTTKTMIVDGKTYHDDYYECYGKSYAQWAMDQGSDNGEQCLNNCSGNSLPSN